MLKYLSIFVVRHDRGAVDGDAAAAAGRYGKLSTVPVDKRGHAALTAAWHRDAIGVPKKKAKPAAGGQPVGSGCLHPDRAVPK
ncbi:hypothetical protein CBM2586_B90368 [Cupriavidus phytorum]|uniref:Uncharacterized protein n=1 Tax=Cupriavidus taiwanensis TaxID=164546 RepID=A0A375CPF4_9BURK|nr:hypothetical protein CBM2586_B90368 [Cupriavidus taiwanensis]